MRTELSAVSASVAERSRRAAAPEFLFDRTMQQECQRGDEDVRLCQAVCAVIDRPHADDVLEAGEGTLDIG